MAIILLIVVLIFSVIIHEVSHGLAALKLGDPTAKYAGRLTLNPMDHLDPVGSVILPLILFLARGPIFGWAKPVPYNPYNLRDQKYGPAIVGVAGPLSNIVLALIAGVMMKAAIVYGIGEGTLVFSLLGTIVYVNVVLTVFNLIPIPPLDGSKLLFVFLPVSEYTKISLEKYGFFFLVAFIFIFGPMISNLIAAVLNVFTTTIIGVSPDFLYSL